MWYLSKLWNTGKQGNGDRSDPYAMVCMGLTAT